MQSYLALRFLVTLRQPVHEIFAFFFKHQIEEGLDADVSEDCHCIKKDFCSSKNNFRGHDIYQGLDREPPSRSPHFLLVILMINNIFHSSVVSKTGAGFLGLLTPLVIVSNTFVT